MDQLDQLEELREMNARHARVNHEAMLQQHMAHEEELLKLQEQEEDKLVQEIMRQSSSGQTIKRIQDEDSNEEVLTKRSRQEQLTSSKATDVLADGSSNSAAKEKKETWQCSVGSFGKTSLARLVKRKAAPTKLSTE